MLKVNFSGANIDRPGYFGDPWWDKLCRLLKRERKYTDEQLHAFLCMTDTLIRLDLHEEGLWRGRNVK